MPPTARWSTLTPMACAAMSIMAECIAVRFGRDGGRFREKGSDRKRNHADDAAGAAKLPHPEPQT